MTRGSCPLLTESEWDADANGVFWDTAIPMDCKDCFKLGLLDSAVPKQICNYDHSSDWDSPESYDLAERYTCLGVKPEAQGNRRGLVEVGIDCDGANQGPIESLTAFVFRCLKENNNP